MPLKNNLRYIAVLAVFLLFSFTLFGESLVHAQEVDSHLNNEVNELVKDNSVIIGETIIVKYKDSVAMGDVKEDFNTNSLFYASRESDVSLVSDTTALVTYDSDKDLKLGLKVALSKDEVEYAQPLYKYTKFADYNPTANPSFASQWYLQNQASGINLPAALGKIGTIKGVDCTTNQRCGGETSVKVAVVDSGVHIDGTEIANSSVDTANGSRFFYNSDNSCQPGEFFETLNLGTVSSPVLINFCRKIGEFTDDDGHGTTVASSIIMENNTTLGVGTAYNTTLLPVALNGSFTYNSFIVGEAINYAVDQGAKVINLSMGTSVDDPFLRQAVQYAYGKGTTIIVSSGNCGSKTAFTCGIGSNNTITNPKIYPAEYPEIISVGAVNYATTVAGITRSSYSSYGDSTDFMVGVGDGSVNPYGVHGLNSTGAYSTNNTGTSFASPVLAGVVALAYSINPNITPALIKQYLIASSKDLLTPGFDQQTGYGLLDASAFVDAVNAQKLRNEYDFDANGLQDILFQAQSDGTALFWSLQDNSSYISSQAIANPNSPFWKVQGTADIDGNGFTDILVRNSLSGQLYIWFVNNGKFSVGKSFASSPSNQYKVIGLYDFNNDGVSDILFQDQTNGQANVWYLNKNGDVTGGANMANPNDASWRIKGVYKIDGANKNDIILQNDYTHNVVMWKFDNAVYTGAVVYSNPIAAEWQVVGLAKMNGDANEDILFQNNLNGQINSWYLASDKTLASGVVLANPNNPVWKYVAYVNYDNNQYTDILLQNSVDGSPFIWKFNASGYYQGAGFYQLGVPGLNWKVVK